MFIQLEKFGRCIERIITLRDISDVGIHLDDDNKQIYKVLHKDAWLYVTKKDYEKIKKILLEA